MLARAFLRRQPGLIPRRLRRNLARAFCERGRGLPRGIDTRHFPEKEELEKQLTIAKEFIACVELVARGDLNQTD